MKAMVISGSRNPQGQTARATDGLVAGLKSGGATSEVAYLPTLRIERCRQCDAAGWGLCRTEGRCVIEDDFAGLVEKLRAADLAVFATPVYFADLSESLRAFLDRLRRICRHDAGKVGLAGKPALGICVAGGGGGGAPNCTLSLEKFLTGPCAFAVADMVPVRKQNLELKIELLRATGQWLAGQKQGQ